MNLRGWGDSERRLMVPGRDWSSRITVVASIAAPGPVVLTGRTGSLRSPVLRSPCSSALPRTMHAARIRRSPPLLWRRELEELHVPIF